MTEPITTVAVDDEPLALRRVMSLLSADPGIAVTGGFQSAKQAARFCGHSAPQLMVLDVGMPELDGLALVHALAARGIKPWVIFVTASAEHSVEAYAAGAIDYLLKPFGDERFARALERAKSLVNARMSAAPSAPSAPMLAPRTRLLLSDNGRIVVLAMGEIEFVQVAKRRVRIYAGGRCYAFRHGLSALEQRLDPARFVRVHRSTLVNIEHIAEMHPLFHGDCELVLRRGTRLTLSRRYRKRLVPLLLT